MQQLAAPHPWATQLPGSRCGDTSHQQWAGMAGVPRSLHSHFIIRELYIYIGVMFHTAVCTLYPSLLRGASWVYHRCPNPKHQNELCFSEHWQKLRNADTKQRGAEQLPGTRREAAFASVPPKPSQGQRQWWQRRHHLGGTRPLLVAVRAARVMQELQQLQPTCV